MSTKVSESRRRRALSRRLGHVEPEQAPSFGEVLRSARRTRGLSLEDAERETRIPLKYLAALEDQEYGALPSSVYARGVLRAYANFLGLASEPLLEQYRPPQVPERTAIRPALPLPSGGPRSPGRCSSVCSCCLAWFCWEATYTAST